MAGFKIVRGTEKKYAIKNRMTGKVEKETDCYKEAEDFIFSRTAEDLTNPAFIYPILQAA